MYGAGFQSRLAGFLFFYELANGMQVMNSAKHVSIPSGGIFVFLQLQQVFTQLFCF